MQRAAMRLLGILVFGIFFFSANVIHAREYLGFSPGTQTRDEVIMTLKKNNAVFDPNYGYKGYTNLPFIKVISYEKFNKLGTVKEAWLEFTPDKKLYRITVTWENGDKTFKVLKDALDTKYGQPAIPGVVENMGFRKQYRYRDNAVEILLELNEFGFQPTVSLSYTYTPATQAFEREQQRIRDAIRQKNASKAGADL